jgi:selenocysteine-specific elongation factor
MLVIAADEGVMPQTREHLAILDLLGVAGAVVVLTKVDRVDDPEWLELVQMEVSDLLAPTHLHGAPILSVSAVTGLGLAVLKERLAHLVAGLPPRRNRGLPRLAVDRVFSLSGFGTVGTGTLLDGELRVGDTVEILPAQLNARIRSLQTHRQPVEVGRAGSRLAVNLTGLRIDQLQRGDVVAHPATLQPTRLLDAQFCLLAAAPRPLKHNQTVDCSWERPNCVLWCASWGVRRSSLASRGGCSCGWSGRLWLCRVIVLSCASRAPVQPSAEAVC